ncbi:SDR family oxidoreductase [Mobilicoccus massiliensis]|uniref:SDR family oxidoreductase n=1 Tax=Mobilicoccus massiliensis TaxID=1522310 RepID=UPI0005911888|nr:SDR family oxidoreductase [Mobilicoccus massiliensis]
MSEQQQSDRRVAVITGANRGIGSHLAGAFAEAGYAVEGCSRSGGPTRVPARSDEGDVTLDLAAVDVTDEQAVHDWIAGVLERHGRIDVLVNNAGVIDDEVPIEESDPEQWWRTIEVDVRGPYLLTRMVLPGMLAAGSGRVINLNSGAGVRPGEVASAYNVAKSALGRITGSTDLSGRGRGVYAFDLAPGVVRTDMTGAMTAHEGRTEWTSPAEVCELALALAAGELDAWSGRMVRAGADTPETLRTASAQLGERGRRVMLVPWGDDDPLA